MKEVTKKSMKEGRKYGRKSGPPKTGLKSFIFFYDYCHIFFWQKKAYRPVSLCASFRRVMRCSHRSRRMTIQPPITTLYAGPPARGK
jgi:hypothetical protein